jgi:hypothetical protein
MLRSTRIPLRLSELAAPLCRRPQNRHLVQVVLQVGVEGVQFGSHRPPPIPLRPFGLGL